MLMNPFRAVGRYQEIFFLKNIIPNKNKLLMLNTIKTIRLLILTLCRKLLKGMTKNEGINS